MSGLRAPASLSSLARPQHAPGAKRPHRQPCLIADRPRRGVAPPRALRLTAVLVPSLPMRVSTAPPPVESVGAVVVGAAQVVASSCRVSPAASSVLLVSVRG